MVVWRDITQYRQVEATLRDSEARFKALFQGAPDAIIITDKNSRILLVNNQSITLFGYPMDELTGTSFEILIPKDIGKHTLNTKKHLSMRLKRARD